MKKFLIGILIFILSIILLGVGTFLYLKIPLRIEKVLPAGAVVYLKITDVEDNVKEFIQLPVWQTLLNLNYDRLVKAKILTQEQKDHWEGIKQNQEEIVDHFMFKKLFGKEVSIAFYIDDINEDLLEKISSDDASDLAADLLTNVFFVTRLAPEAQIMESFLKPLSSSLGEDVKMEFSHYKGHTIQTFVPSQENVVISMTRIKDLLVLGLGDKAAKAAIDVIKKEKRSLDKDPDFIFEQQRALKSSDVEVFFHWGRVIAMISPAIEKMMAGNRTMAKGSDDPIKQTMDNLNQFKTVGVSMVFDPVAQVKMNIQKNSEVLQGEPKEFCVVRDNGSIKIIPEDVLFYGWNSCFNLDYIWSEMKKELSKAIIAQEGGMASDKIKVFEQQIGLQIEQDLLPVFGREIGFYLANIDVQKAFVLPEMLFFVEIQDQDKANILLNTLTSRTFFPLKEEVYADTAIHYMEMPFPGIGPAYCYLDKYFLVAVNADLLKRSIDLYKQGSGSLVDAEDFKNLEVNMIDKKVAIFFSRVHEISVKFKDIIDFVGVIVDGQDNKIRAFQSGSQKRLKDMKDNVNKNQERLIDLEKQRGPLEDKIWDLEAIKDEATVEKNKLKDLEETIRQLKTEIEADRKMIEELNEGIIGYARALEDSMAQKIYIDEVVEPVLNSFSFIHSFLIRQNNGSELLETMMLIKTQE